MSSMLYGAISAKREAATAGQSTSASAPGVGTYIDALAALVPAEVLGLHAIILSFCTKTYRGATVISEPSTLKWAFWALLALAALLFVAGRWQAKTTGVKAPALLTKLPPILTTLVQAAIPAAAFVAWTMLLKVSAFDAVASGLATGARDTIAVIAAVVLGVIAGLLGYKLNKAAPNK